MNNKICDNIHNDNLIDKINKNYNDENLDRKNTDLNNDKFNLKNDKLVLNGENAALNNEVLINENSTSIVAEKINIPFRSLAGMREVSVRDYSDSKVLEIL